MIEKRTASVTFSSKHNFLKYKSYLGVHLLACTNAPPSVFSKVALLVMFRSMCIPTHIPVHQNCVCVLKCQWIKSRCIDPVQSIWQQPSPHQLCTLRFCLCCHRGKTGFWREVKHFQQQSDVWYPSNVLSPSGFQAFCTGPSPFQCHLSEASGMLCDIAENTVKQICFWRTSNSTWLLSRWHFGSRHCAVPPKYCPVFVICFRPACINKLVQGFLTVWL